ncbi:MULTISPECIES: HD domain-containing protein [unclassified Desulfovibrio]|uniref:HD domain-containing protein n=1 Tax=unclassified Desulfovibrio TaxID=2593640 RepID=UPI000F5D70CA|nr:MULTISPECIES: HD domain-containing protein [unclassified Desulfovibrio]RRD71592.1 HD domain-containing protein [Desulfovibrio sp. OH1209_COT-279]RRD87837.1 HD domain-containing protein [Desulfovibrio sp. OH1186_COT-070]
MIRKSLLQLIFSGSYLLRWNDKLRPVELLEIDKQAHKMLIACILWHENSRDLPMQQRVALAQHIIEGGLFDYFYRLIITDIKPPIFYKIKDNPLHYAQLTKHVLGRLEPVMAPLGPFWERMCHWHTAPEEDSLTRRILAAAHLFASQWEFRLIEPLNRPFDDEIDDIGKSFPDRLNTFTDLQGLALIQTPGTALFRLANLCGQLRFQIRWTQAPRIPATSVLGHMFIVACFAYFFSLAVNACQARANNNFFCGLFHDLPEVLTRDIISPVKQSISSLPQIIKEYEDKELERRVFAPLRAEGLTSLAERIEYYLGSAVGSEFQESVCENGRIRSVDGFSGLNAQNRDELDPKDGQLVKICDNLAAFLEAHSSIRNGVSSPHLLEARVRLLTGLRESPLTSLHLDTLLADFD